MSDPKQPENGPDAVGLRTLHPALYRALNTMAVGSTALGLNFLIFNPTFFIFGMPNYLWAGLLLVTGTGQLLFLNVSKRLRRVRQGVALNIAAYLILAAGTSQVPLEGKGSFQLPLMYLILAVLQFPLLIEPPVNPWTRKRVNG